MRLVKQLYLEFAFCILFIFFSGSFVLYLPIQTGDIDANVNNNDKQITMYLWITITYMALIIYLVMLENQYVSKNALKTSYQDLSIEFSHMEVN